MTLSNYLTMKKILSLLVLLVAFVSCEEDVKFNNPAVQGFKDDELWKATEFSAAKSGNSVIVTATNGFETVVLRIANPVPGTSADKPVAGVPIASEHVLGVDEVNKATYSLNVEGVTEFYQTGTGLGNGKITMGAAGDNNLAATNGAGYISGSFYFNAVNDLGVIVNFQRSVFYKVPITTVQ